MKKLSEEQLINIEAGGTDPDKVVSGICAVAGIVTFFGGVFSGGLGWILGGAVTTGFCSGYGAAYATS